MKSLMHKDFHCNINVMARKKKTEGKREKKKQTAKIFQYGRMAKEIMIDPFDEPLCGH